MQSKKVKRNKQKEQKKKHKFKGIQLATEEFYFSRFLGKTNRANCQVAVQKLSNLTAT